MLPFAKHRVTAYMCMDSPDQRELCCTWHTACWRGWADHQSKEEQQQFKDLNPFGWESCLLLAKSKESSVLEVTSIFGWQKTLLKSLQATDTKKSQKKDPLFTKVTSVSALQFGMKFPVQPRGALVAQCQVVQVGRGDPYSNSCPTFLPAPEWGKIFG